MCGNTGIKKNKIKKNIKRVCNTNVNTCYTSGRIASGIGSDGGRERESDARKHTYTHTQIHRQNQCSMRLKTFVGILCSVCITEPKPKPKPSGSLLLLVLLLRCSLYPRIFASFYTYTCIKRWPYRYIHSYTILIALAHCERMNERYLYCRRIFKSNEKKSVQHERKRKRGRNNNNSTNKNVSIVVFPIFASALCVRSSLIIAASSKSLLFVRLLLLPLHIWVSSLWVCVWSVPSSSGCLLTCCCWYFSWNESRIYTKHSTVDSYGTKAIEWTTEQLNTFRWGITHESRWWCAQQDSEIPISSVTMILFSCSSFSLSLYAMLLLFFIACSFSSIHSNSHERTQMVISLWMTTMMGKWFSLIFKKLSAYLII